MTRKLAGAVLASIALVGCSLTRTDRSPEASWPDLGATSGRVILPKRCRLELAVATRPVPDAALGEAVWRVADVQVIDSQARRALEANGLRMGVITGDLPPDVQAVLDDERVKAGRATFDLPDGDGTLIDLAASGPELDLLLNREGNVAGKHYADAHGFLRATARHEGESAVAVRIVPELHHGPVRQGWDAAPGGALAPQQFIVKNGQAEETFRDLAVTLDLMPGQVVVVGALPDRQGSLGGFLFAATEANSDRMLQKVVFLWASRASDAPDGLQPAEPPEIPRRETATP